VVDGIKRDKDVCGAIKNVMKYSCCRPNQTAQTETLKMKRKLDENDVPAPAEEVKEAKKDLSFNDLALDSRLLQGILKQNFHTPTPVQAKAIPLALEGRDILARAKTGSGKTLAYLLPILDSILKRKQVCLRNLLLIPGLC